MQNSDFLKNKAGKEDIIPNELFAKLKGQVIQNFSVKGNADQYFHLITDKSEVEFGANDLGVWIEKYKLKESSCDNT